MQWQLGKVGITRIEELIGPLFDPVRFFPDFDPAIFKQHRGWLYPDHVDEKSGRIISSMHSWLIETDHHKILIDTCIGNDKQRMPYRNWHEMQTPWLDNLTAAGVKPEEIDYVMCTHLHVDHVGWNTRLDNGQWVPTFPNAKYVFSKDEYEFWKAERDRENPDTFAQVNNQTFDDSVLPIMRLAELIEGETELITDLLRVNPRPATPPAVFPLSFIPGARSVFLPGIFAIIPYRWFVRNGTAPTARCPTWRERLAGRFSNGVATRVR